MKVILGGLRVLHSGWQKKKKMERCVFGLEAGGGGARLAVRRPTFL